MIDTESVIPHFALGDLDGEGRKEVCISLPGETGRRLVILDGQGRNGFVMIGRCSPPARSLVRPWSATATAATSTCCAGPPVDLDGDGRDELLLRDDKRLSASRSDLTGLGRGVTLRWCGRSSRLNTAGPRRCFWRAGSGWMG